MALEHRASHGDLLDRADRAIADAIRTRARVRADLTEAGRRYPWRPWAGDARPAEPRPPEPLPPDDFLEPWWSIARALTDTTAIVREADAELEGAWCRIMPTI